MEKTIKIAQVKEWFWNQKDIKCYIYPNWYKVNYTDNMEFDLEIVRETEKAVLIRLPIKYFTGFKGKPIEFWCPKSQIIELKENKKYMNFEYHHYLENVFHKAYDDGIIENTTIVSGRNRYRGDAFIHQWGTKQLIEYFKKERIPFMTKEEFIK